MVCRTPANHGQLSSADSEGSNSCVAYSFAYSASNASNCTVTPTGSQIRDWTNDHNGGLELTQCDWAVTAHTNLSYDTGIYTRTQFYAKLNNGYGAVLLVGYRPLGVSKFSGQDWATFNHGIYVPPTLKVMDPLCDGRRAGVYKYKGEAYPKYLIEAAAASLRMSNGKVAGQNHFEASFIKIKAAPIKHYAVKFDGGTIGYYHISATTGRITGVTTMTGRNPFLLRCSAPKLYSWPGHTSRRLVQILEGFAKGRFVNLGNDSLHLKEV